MPSPASTSRYLFWALNALLGTAGFVELAKPHLSPAFDAVTIALAAMASIAALNRQLPLQNVLPVALITAVFGGVAHGLSACSGVSLPLGPVMFNSAAGARIFNFVPWTIPLIWIVAIFNARGVGRLILRPWRKVKTYGFWLIGLTAVLAVAFDLALEPYAWHVKGFWRWSPTKIAVTWEGTTLLNFVGWIFISLLIMAFATPSMIRKQPGNPSKPDLHPLFLWLGAFVIFAAGCASAGLGVAFGVDAAILVVTTVFAVRGALW